MTNRVVYKTFSTSDRMKYKLCMNVDLSVKVQTKQRRLWWWEEKERKIWFPGHIIQNFSTINTWLLNCKSVNV